MGSGPVLDRIKEGPALCPNTTYLLMPVVAFCLDYYYDGDTREVLLSMFSNNSRPSDMGYSFLEENVKHGCLSLFDISRDDIVVEKSSTDMDPDSQEHESLSAMPLFLNPGEETYSSITLGATKFVFVKFFQPSVLSVVHCIYHRYAWTKCFNFREDDFHKDACVSFFDFKAETKFKFHVNVASQFAALVQHFGLLLPYYKKSVVTKEKKPSKPKGDSPEKKDDEQKDPDDDTEDLFSGVVDFSQLTQQSEKSVEQTVSEKDKPLAHGVILALSPNAWKKKGSAADKMDDYGANIYGMISLIVFVMSRRMDLVRVSDTTFEHVDRFGVKRILTEKERDAKRQADMRRHQAQKEKEARKMAGDVEDRSEEKGTKSKKKRKKDTKKEEEKVFGIRFPSQWKVRFRFFDLQNEFDLLEVVSVFLTNRVESMDGPVLSPEQQQELHLACNEFKLEHLLDAFDNPEAMTFFNKWGVPCTFGPTKFLKMSNVEVETYLKPPNDATQVEKSDGNVGAVGLITDSGLVMHASSPKKKVTKRSSAGEATKTSNTDAATTQETTQDKADVPVEDSKTQSEEAEGDDTTNPFEGESRDVNNAVTPATAENNVTVSEEVPEKGETDDPSEETTVVPEKQDYYKLFIDVENMKKHAEKLGFSSSALGNYLKKSLRPDELEPTEIVFFSDERNFFVDETVAAKNDFFTKVVGDNADDDIKRIMSDDIGTLLKFTSFKYSRKKQQFCDISMDLAIKDNKIMLDFFKAAYHRFQYSLVLLDVEEGAKDLVSSNIHDFPTHAFKLPPMKKDMLFSDKKELWKNAVQEVLKLLWKTLRARGYHWEQSLLPGSERYQGNTLFEAKFTYAHQKHPEYYLSLKRYFKCIFAKAFVFHYPFEGQGIFPGAILAYKNEKQKAYFYRAPLTMLLNEVHGWYSALCNKAFETKEKRGIDKVDGPTTRDSSSRKKGRKKSK